MTENGHPRRRSRGAAVLALLVSAAAAAAGWAGCHTFRSNMNTAACASNLHQIGLGILLYQQDHGGRYPDTLGELVELEGISPACLTCPAADDEPATGPTTRAVVADLVAGGHLSYVYVGRGLTDNTVADDTVVCYEPLANHSGAGMNVLFGDGHAEWVPRAKAVGTVARLAAGERPVRLRP